MPEGDPYLWRYMSFAKWCSLIFSRSLTFVSPRLFTDKHEGDMGAGQAREYAEEIARKALERKLGQSLHNSVIDEWRHFVDTDAESAASASRIMRRVDADYRRALNSRYVSCWHENTQESESMWNMYSPQGDGVALVIRLSRLLHLVKLQSTHTVTAASVRYADDAYFRLESDLCLHDLAMNRLFVERKPFEAEKEFRMVVEPPKTEGHDGPPADVIHVPFDFDRLSEEGPAAESPDVFAVSDPRGGRHHAELVALVNARAEVEHVIPTRLSDLTKPNNSVWLEGSRLYHQR